MPQLGETTKRGSAVLRGSRIHDGIYRLSQASVFSRRPLLRERPPRARYPHNRNKRFGTVRFRGVWPRRSSSAAPIQRLFDDCAPSSAAAIQPVPLSVSTSTHLPERLSSLTELSLATVATTRPPLPGLDRMLAGPRMTTKTVSFFGAAAALSGKAAGWSRIDGCGAAGAVALGSSVFGVASADWVGSLLSVDEGAFADSCAVAAGGVGAAAGVGAVFGAGVTPPAATAQE